MSERYPGRPKKTEWDRCKAAEGCDKTTEGGSKGFCPSHAVSVRRGRRDETTGVAAPRKRVTSYGPGARCIIPQCGRRPKGRDLCTMHYQQWEDGDDLGVKVPKRGHTKTVSSYEMQACIVVGCDLRPVNKRMCSKHAQQRDAKILNEFGAQIRDLMPQGRPRTRDRWVSNRDGYVLTWAPEGHPKSRQDGTILEHRLVMERHLERFLEEKEVVHHLNGHKDDNRIENLQFRNSQAEHGHGHEPIEDVEEALRVLERFVNCGMTHGSTIRARLNSLALRLANAIEDQG